MNNKKVSFIDNETIEYTATEILKRAAKQGFYDFNSPTPIDLIVDNILNIQMNFTDLSEEKLLGALDPKNNTLWLDESFDNPKTQNFTSEAICNFTIAHECGHFMFHKSLYSNDKETMVQFHNYDNPQTKRVEKQANMFAAYILMPTVLIMKRWSKIDYSAPFEKTLFELTRFFKVSREAMIIRLQNAKLIDAEYQ